jgi:hypothetical protein
MRAVGRGVNAGAQWGAMEAVAGDDRISGEGDWPAKSHAAA